MDNAKSEQAIETLLMETSQGARKWTDVTSKVERLHMTAKAFASKVELGAGRSNNGGPWVLVYKVSFPRWNEEFERYISEEDVIVEVCSPDLSVGATVYSGFSRYRLYDAVVAHYVGAESAIETILSQLKKKPDA